MTRTHRAVHRVIWPVLAIGICFGFLMALALRAPPPVQAPPAAQENAK